MGDPPMTDVDELTAWLRAQLDEDERVARAPVGPDWTEDSSWLKDMLDPLPSQRRDRPGWLPMITVEDIRHIARHDPARVLREVEAKRRIIDEWEDPAEVENLPEGVQDGRDWNERDEQVAVAHAIDHIVRLLALPYADRPGYREEWEPA